MHTEKHSREDALLGYATVPARLCFTTHWKLPDSQTLAFQAKEMAMLQFKQESRTEKQVRQLSGLQKKRGITGEDQLKQWLQMVAGGSALSQNVRKGPSVSKERKMFPPQKRTAIPVPGVLP